MKKTIKKSLILIAVITVMMICALVLPASAEEGCSGGKHIKEYVEVVYTDPTCEDEGYSVDYCTYCKEAITAPYDDVAPTGHTLSVVGYEANDGGTAYCRVTKCSNPVCKRATETQPEIKGKEIRSDYVYHSVEFLNEFESPEPGEVDNHKSYFLEYYYVEDNEATWVVDLSKGDASYYPEFYAPAAAGNAKAETGEDINVVINPEYEYFDNNGKIELYVLKGHKAYYSSKDKPVRCKDTQIGKYTFNAWVAGDETIDTYTVNENTTFTAKFDGVEGVVVTYTFMKSFSDTASGQQTIGYGKAAVYNGATPTKEPTLEYSYKFNGWKVDNDTYYAQTPITLYHNAKIYAQYDETRTEYKIAFEDYKGDAFKDSDDAEITGTAFYNGKVSKTAVIDSAMIKRPSDHMYNYAPAENQWQITAVNGYRVAAISSGYKFDINTLRLPQETSVVNENGETVRIRHTDYDVITVAPVYYRQAIVYDITVTIKHIYFEEEDLYDSSTPRSDILDDFVVQVYDGNGNYVTAGKTDSNGQVTFKLNYADKYRFTATTMDINKYYGENEIVMSRVYSTIEFTGVFIAPSATEEWKNSQVHYCSCMCHGILSPIVIKVYNLLYRLFGYKYICCDDLFAAHGDILVYMK